ncbi:hypothetical protein EV284_1729 [Streptomyces sp. BK022]|uniref:hypothetical protein n=1 Tax=Streptomyces sp. BK022 TaxID=2512123 RepID=UPI0010E366C6|nr:hypothetical protein [Streptomyces sp. BK022]RZU44269.1 hypothetical protein EV284_1729 [Streptomyces sp. BK022]
MSTVREIAALLPAPSELRAHLRALAVLEAAICDDPEFCQYTFDPAWGPGEEAALMDNGSGDDFSVLFTPAGVLIRGFDHESEMSPYGTEDEQVWPGVMDDVPASLRPLLDEPAFYDDDLDTPRITACLWWETGDTAWRTGSAIAFPDGNEDPDGSGFLFRLLVDRSPDTVRAHFEDYYERPVPVDAVRHVLAGHALTAATALALNPAALADDALLQRIAAQPEAAAFLAGDGEFDVTRTDPIESIVLPNGLPVEPVAGCNAGGTHYLCGPALPGSARPVLYTDSEGRASLIAESLAEALTLAVVLPSWHDALSGFRPPALNADYLDDHPDHPPSRTASSPRSASPRPPSGRSWTASSPPPPAPSPTDSSPAHRTRRNPPSSHCSASPLPPVRPDATRTAKDVGRAVTHSPRRLTTDALASTSSEGTRSSCGHGTTAATATSPLHRAHSGPWPRDLRAARRGLAPSGCRLPLTP